MKIHPWAKTLSTLVLSVSSLLAVAHAEAAKRDPVEQLYNFQATGSFFGADASGITYEISAIGRAPRVTGSGNIVPRSKQEQDDDDFKVVLTGAKITFKNFDPSAPIVNFSCEGCELTYPDGSKLTSDPAVPLEGRAFFLYGPVAPTPNNPVVTIRMAGCSGLKEIAGKGKLAGKVGSICFNGVFNFDMSIPGVLPSTLTGESNCTIVTHSPAF